MEDGQGQDTCVYVRVTPDVFLLPDAHCLFSSLPSSLLEILA